ncbi:hypothetical protein IMSHALPRED_008322 [Imshaugia aleurites]|uniref:Dolichyl-diphosphooligosaccharide--protein glycosyltransferase subunit 4 n=1 Tax=Imshaugia aleurites TaxID=172621 RepID=A0A8H3FTS2_9LECA|nr:hypothetical protein IMSHALPRED_008322 [Imshaugia aleurites]
MPLRRLLLTPSKALNFPITTTFDDSSQSDPPLSIMISDDDLYTLAIFLGSLAMLLIVLYHFLEVNAIDDGPTQSEEKTPSKSPSQAQARATAKS